MDGLHGVVLAGGLSSRMGFAKALAPLGGRFFLQAVYEQLVRTGAAPVHVVLNPGLLIALGTRKELFSRAVFVENREPARGQIHSLRLALQSAQEAKARAALVTLVDLPTVRDETLRLLAGRATTAPGRLLLPRHQGRRGHPILIPASLFAPFLNAAPGETGRDVIRALMNQPGTVAHVDVPDPGILHDMDSLADLMKAADAAEQACPGIGSSSGSSRRGDD